MSHCLRLSPGLESLCIFFRANLIVVIQHCIETVKSEQVKHVMEVVIMDFIACLLNNLNWEEFSIKFFWYSHFVLIIYISPHSTMDLTQENAKICNS